MYLYKVTWCYTDECTYTNRPSEVFIAEDDDKALQKAVDYPLYDKENIEEIEKIEVLDDYKIILKKI